MGCRVVVLISGSGSNLQAIIDGCSSGRVAAEVVAVISNQADAYGLERARQAGISAEVVSHRDHADRASFDAALAARIDAQGADLVVLAGFMKLVGPAFLGRFGGRTINTHPALLPSFPGMHGPRDALAHGVKITGTTVFEVDAGVDTGRILAQEPVRVLSGDTVDSLHERIKVAERVLLVRTVNERASKENS